jgi:hypothetical protein
MFFFLFSWTWRHETLKHLTAFGVCLIQDEKNRRGDGVLAQVQAAALRGGEFSKMPAFRKAQRLHMRATRVRNKVLRLESPS